MRNRIAVIDPGTTSLRLLVGEKDANGIKIVAGVSVPSYGVKHGEIVNVMQTLNALNAAVAKMRSDFDIEVNKAYIVCATSDMECIAKSGSMDRSENLWGEMISSNELKQINLDIMSEVNNSPDTMVYAIIPQSYNVDNYMGLGEDEVEGTIGKHISGTFKVVAGKRQYITACNNVCRRAGIKISGYIVSPIASACAAVAYDERELGVALIDIGASTTKVSVINNNVTSYCGVIGFGGNNITEDIMKECNVGSDTAEYLKKRYNICLCSRVERDLGVKIPAGHGREKRTYSVSLISKIIEARMSELLEAALWHINRSGMRDELGGGIVISGGCANMQFITELAYRITGLGCQIADSSRNISNDTSLDLTEPELATVAGAVIYCFSRKEIPDYLEEGAAGGSNLFNTDLKNESEAACGDDARNQESGRDGGDMASGKEGGKPKKKGGFIKTLGSIFSVGSVFADGDEA